MVIREGEICVFNFCDIPHDLKGYLRLLEIPNTADTYIIQ